MYLSQAHGGVGNIIQKGLEPFQEGKSGNCLDFYQGNFPGAETAWDTEQRALLGLEGRECWWSKSILTQAPVSLKFSSFPRERSRGCCTLLHGSGAWICSFQLLTWLWCILGLLMCDDFNMWVWKVIFSSSLTLLFRVSVTGFFWEMLLDWFCKSLHWSLWYIFHLKKICHFLLENGQTGQLITSPKFFWDRCWSLGVH